MWSLKSLAQNYFYCDLTIWKYFENICTMNGTKTRDLQLQNPYHKIHPLGVQLWIDFKFLHMTDVEKSEISFNMCTIYGILLHFKLFCCKICVFLRFTLFCRKIGLLRFTRFCVEKIIAKNSVRGDKMTNMRSAIFRKFQIVWGF